MRVLVNDHVTQFTLFFFHKEITDLFNIDLITKINIITYGCYKVYQIIRSFDDKSINLIHFHIW